MKKPKGLKIVSQEIAEASPHSLPASSVQLTRDEMHILEMDVEWLQWRSDFRKIVVASGQLRTPWRNIFEADAILSLIAHRWLTKTPITLKEISTYLSEFCAEATISRHIDDMEFAGMLNRVRDPSDNRRLLLIPTERLLIVGRNFLQAKLTLLKNKGFQMTGPSEE